MSEKQILKNLIGNDNIAEAITKLHSATSKLPRLHNEIVQLSARFQQNERQRRLGVANNDDVNLEYNKIRNALLSVIDELPETKGSSIDKKNPNWMPIALSVVVLVLLVIFGGKIKEVFLGTQPIAVNQPLKDSTQGITKPVTPIKGVSQPPTEPRNPTNQLEVNKPQATVEPSIETNTDTYFNKNLKTDVAILVDSDNKKAGALTSSAVSAYFSEKGLANNPVFFRTPFISKFGERLKDNDISVFNSLDVQKTANCVCVIHQDDYKLDNQTVENIELKKASASYHITMFYLNGSGSPQTFQFDTQGAGANESMAQESLTDHFTTLFKNQSIHFNQCKK